MGERAMMRSASVLLWMVIAMTNNPVNAAPPDLQASLLEAAGANQVQRLRELLAQGVDIEARDADGRSALLLATRSNAIEAARLLIEAGADVNAADRIHDSPFLYAGAEGRLEILRMTLRHGADLASVNRYGGTALIPAAHHGHVDTVRELLDTDIDIDHVNNLGWTALLEAVILGDGGPTYVSIIELLLAAGADVDIADGDGVTPLQHAVARGYETIAEMLRAGAGPPAGARRADD
jgi:ankyrin repeat protein